MYNRLPDQKGVAYGVQMYRITCENSKDSDKPTYQRRLIVIFFVGLNLLDTGGSILGKVKVLLLLCSG